MPFGEMYQRWTLDCIVEVARLVSRDFSTARPLHYKQVPPAVCDLLADLETRTGHEPAWPDANQRAAFYGNLFGPSDGKPVSGHVSDFHRLAAAVREAATRYTEGGEDRAGRTPGEPILLQRFRDSQEELRRYLIRSAGPAIDFREQQANQIFDAAANVLRDQEVARAFGKQQPQVANWPRETANFDSDGASLVDEITRQLVPDKAGRITESQFLRIQRVASRGRETIEG